jgi:uncharacterized protein YciI
VLRSLRYRKILLYLLLAIAATSGIAQVRQTAAIEQNLPLFAVEIKVGSKWDQSNPPQEQQYFREHSANLKRLRDAGNLIMGARYSDKGLVILAAQTEEEAKAMMDVDPSIKGDVFKYELHPFGVFYSGSVNQRPR